ncbi:ankyrin repeat-containing domain protein, partial [Coprinopsis sp. MPI-PUGE-AT-0042]
LLTCPETLVNLVDNEGWSALMKAAFHGHKGIVTDLLSYPGTMVNSPNNKGWSALMLAAYGGHEGIVSLLL